MPFNSLSFIFFFFVFVVFYYIFKNQKLKSFLLLTGSYFFYAYYNIFNLIFLLLTTLITFLIANRLIQHKQRYFLFFIGTSFILVQLIFAKYSNTIFNFQIASSLEFSFFNIFIFPLGISFYSLQAISLLADVRSGRYKGDISLNKISQFLSFFPQSISGPIHRANELIPQFSITKSFNTQNLIIGFKIMLLGYIYKLIVADKIALIVTPVFSSFQEYDGFSISVATLLYSYQIYFDFWGYSLIAIGVGRILGFTINVNFRNPYSVSSFKEFWHRWHITLSRWMRDYIYIPLGGNNQRHYLYFCSAILVTFLASGFWHGVTFNFILWGAAHAFFYLAEDAISKNFSFSSLKFYKWLIPLQTVIFFILLSLTWLIFRTESMIELNSLLKSIFTFSEWTTHNFFNHYFTSTNLFYFTIILIVILLGQMKLLSHFTNTVPKTKNQALSESIFICTCLVTVILFGDIGGQEFLYFRF